MRDVLFEHIKKYPQMRVEDAVKLIYQAAYGSEHLVEDKEGCIRRIQTELEEYAAIEDRSAFEDIGGDYMRFYLNSSEARNLPAGLIADMFIATSHYNKGSAELLEKAFCELRALASDGKTPFSEQKVEKYLDSYRRAGYPAVSHSAEYKKRYQPAYRVMLKEYERLYPVISRIGAILLEKGRCVIAADGRSASGKSSFAALMSETFGADVVHMDDFFLPIELRKTERFSTPGGNVHYERFNEEVSEKLNSGDKFQYNVFDCSKMALSGFRTVGSSNIIIVDGAYSLHPKITAKYDLKLFFDIESGEQIKRILKRNGENMLKNFTSRWIPLENEYIESYDIADKCDIVMN